MIRRSPLLLVFVLLFGACQGLFTPQTAELGRPFWLGFDEVVIAPTSAGTLRFSGVMEDSRCPADPGVLCAWAGRVRLQLTTRGFGSQTTTHELRLLDAPGSVVLGGFVIELLDVGPPRPPGDPAPDAEYRARLLITAAP